MNLDLIKNDFTPRGYLAFQIMLDYSLKYPKNFFGDGSINIRHSLNVRNFAVYLQRLVGGDLELTEIAALFHDLGKISTVEGHETLIVKLIKLHAKDLRLSDLETEKLERICGETEVEDIEFQLVHHADDLAFLYDVQYQEAYYRYVGTKELLFEKRMDPKHQSLSLKPAKILGDALYQNAVDYWSSRPEVAEIRYRPEIEGKDLASYQI